MKRFVYTPIEDIRDRKNEPSLLRFVKDTIYDALCSDKTKSRRIVLKDYDFNLSDFTTDDGKTYKSLTIRNGGEALRYTFDENEKFVSVKYTSHYFSNQNGRGSREWKALSESAVKPTLSLIYDSLDYKEKSKSDVDNSYITFSKLVREHSPKRADGKSEYYCSPLANNMFSLKNHSNEEFTFHLDNDGKIATVDYTKWQGNRPNRTTNLSFDNQGKSIWNVTKDSTLSQYCSNACVFFNAEEYIVCYNEKGLNETKEITFKTEEQAQEFLDRLPKTRYEGYIIKEDDNCVKDDYGR